jgi:quinol monooxygenase YgiN
MNQSENAVSIHPYFKIHPGKLEEVKSALPAFIQKTAAEPENLYYGFSLNGDELFCREAYTCAEGLLAHIENVGPELEQMLTRADLVRVEVHGPAAELEKLRGPLESLKPEWFVWLGGVKR